MISASLTFHHPETIYHFLQKNVGPLCMVIKAGLAIINFAKPQHAQMALSKYHNTTLLGMSFKLKPFEEQDLQKQGKTEVINKITIQEPIMPFKIAEDNQPSTKLNEFTILMQQTMQIKDPQNIFQVVTKKSRKEIIEYVNSFAPLLQTAQLKKKQLINSHTNQTEQDKKVQEFVSYYSTGLTNITRSIKKQFKNLRRCCSKYGQQQENIDVDPQIKIDLLPKSNLINLAGFKNKIQYITPEGFQVKRIAALNEKQFICSLNGRQTNSLSFYNVGDEYSKMSLQIKEGAYGLLVLDNYILAGTMQGTIAFFNIKDLSVKEISMKLHNSLIYQLLAFPKRNQSYNVISLSTDNSLKIWNVVQQSFTDDASTLLFEQSLALQDSSNKIISADVIDSSKIVYTKTNNIILHDCTSNKIIASQHTQCNILKVAKVNQHQTAAANERYLSFVDMRNNAKTSNYDITKDVRTLAVLSQYSVFYGCGDGEVGLIDRRFVSKTLWKTNTVHNSRIYDVCRIDNLVLTGDNVGQLASWMPSEMPSRNGIVAQYK